MRSAYRVPAMSLKAPQSHGGHGDKGPELILGQFKTCDATKKQGDLIAEFALPD